MHEKESKMALGQECQCIEESDFLVGNIVGVPMDKITRCVYYIVSDGLVYLIDS